MDTDLIYGIDDRPPLKETLFCRHPASTGYFRGDHNTSLDYRRGAETGSGDDRFLGFHGSVRLRGIHIRSMS